MELVTSVVDAYHNLMKNADPRVDGWLFMNSPFEQGFVLIFYVYFVKNLGPRLMENRKPFDLKNAMIIYNASLVLFSVYLLYEFTMSGWGTSYSFGCELVDYSNSPKGVRMAWTCYLFYFSKLIELMDTVFFVLRKKNSQISFLHVYHHTIMPLTWWFGVKFVAGGLGSFHGWVNSLVHIIMYTYYGLAAAGPAYRKYLWWKKYMTMLQLVQFLVVELHILQFFFMKDCAYSFPIFLDVIFVYGLIFLVLFFNFWYQTYTKVPRPACSMLSNGDIQPNGLANGALQKDK
uniref:very long chain fatty acid elongase 7-like n=1 Tax=Myxine glutinosa TaxID=7769 RepID=UPI00358F771C